MSLHFTQKELACRHCGVSGVKPELVEVLDALREKAGPLQVNSGYRCPKHPVEAKKLAPGFHSKGLAADLHPVRISLREFYKIVLADARVMGIGVDRAGGYIHVDIGERPARTQWVYRHGKAVVVANPMPS